MVVPVGVLPHEIAAGQRGDAARFDHEGYAVGRQMFPPEVLRQVRAPLIEALVAEGHVEPVEGEPDRFRWLGDHAGFDRDRYRPVLAESTAELLVRPGTASSAIEAVWGRRPAMWERGALFVMPPGDPTRVHRDGWQMIGVGGPEEHFNVWCPLTRLGHDDGALAIAVGSHRMADQDAEIAMPHPVHLDVGANTGNRPPAEALAPLWHTTLFEIGDALLFRPDIVHSTVLNTGPYLRIAVGIGGQDARRPLTVHAGLSPDVTRDLAEVEWLTLALLAAQPSSPWLTRCAFYPRGVLGRLGARQPDELIERAFITLADRGLIERHEPRDDEASWIHRYFEATPRGRCDVTEWLTTPPTPGATGHHLLSAKLLLSDWIGSDTGNLLNETRERHDQSVRPGLTC